MTFQFNLSPGRLHTGPCGQVWVLGFKKYTAGESPKEGNKNKKP